MFSLAVFVSAVLDPRPSRSGAAAGRAHSDDGCDHLSYARARPHTIGSSLFGQGPSQGRAASFQKARDWRLCSVKTCLRRRHLRCRSSYRVLGGRIPSCCWPADSKHGSPARHPN